MQFGFILRLYAERVMAFGRKQIFQLLISLCAWCVIVYMRTYRRKLTMLRPCQHTASHVCTATWSFLNTLQRTSLLIYCQQLFIYIFFIWLHLQMTFLKFDCITISLHFHYRGISLYWKLIILNFNILKFHYIEF